MTLVSPFMPHPPIFTSDVKFSRWGKSGVGAKIGRIPIQLAHGQTERIADSGFSAARQ
jgi:hypothetical protein